MSETQAWAELRELLREQGSLSEDWAQAFTDVPRSPFLPDLIWPYDMATGDATPVRWSEDPETWAKYANANGPIVTQWDDGDHDGDTPGWSSSSSASMPSVVFSMLRDLDLRPGQNVLEIGTGTGWSAALMTQRVGCDRVTTIEVDDQVADRAKTALLQFGTPVNVIAGDGAQGYPEGAPYDRVIATCGLRTIPYAWVEQCATGGVIVAPWGTHFTNGDAVARLVVADDGKSASGWFTGAVEFMKLRAQRRPPLVHGDYTRNGGLDAAEKSTTTLTEGEFLAPRFSAQTFALGLAVPHCVRVVADKRNGAQPVWLYELGGESWACVMFDEDSDARVWQFGPRRLWDESEAAYRWWDAQGRPGFDRFGLTVDSDGERAWLDAPDGPVPTHMAA
ncbi:methyltransferase domain-containing protein [Streptomyces sp. NPDC001941]|uniref:methyltransferase domain-containing protein n=1 Tax=Streptomyces sp. NPDC001941 TaxID=3154659 RepID=UPI0033200FBF